MKKCRVRLNKGSSEIKSVVLSRTQFQRFFLGAADNEIENLFGTQRVNMTICFSCCKEFACFTSIPKLKTLNNFLSNAALDQLFRIQTFRIL